MLMLSKFPPLIRYANIFANTNKIPFWFPHLNSSLMYFFLSLSLYLNTTQTMVFIKQVTWIEYEIQVVSRTILTSILYSDLLVGVIVVAFVN